MHVCVYSLVSLATHLNHDPRVVRLVLEDPMHACMFTRHKQQMDIITGVGVNSLIYSYLWSR